MKKKFLKAFAMESSIYCWNEGAVSGVLCKNIFLADLLVSHDLFEILQTSLTVKIVKMW